MIEADVVVLGSGGSGLAAAVAAAGAGGSVAILESSDHWGGTSGTSGGVLWMPDNPYMAENGETDSLDETMGYLSSFGDPIADPEAMQKYFETSKVSMSFLQDAGLEFTAILRPDYRPASVGAKLTRGVEPALYDPAPLGSWADLVYEYEPHVPVRTAEVSGGIGEDVSQPMRVDPAELERRKDAGLWARGRALVGRLLEVALARGATLHVGIRAVRPVVEDGRVVGVADEDGVMIARARRAVVLATGGFEWSEQLAKQFLRAPLAGAMSPRTNVGDGLRIAMASGASLGCMSEAWWTPLGMTRKSAQDAWTFRLTQQERARPGSLMVDRTGRRFVNEAGNYQDVGRAMQRFSSTNFSFDQADAFLVFDERYRREFGIFSSGPNAQVDHEAGAHSEWLYTAATVPELAALLDKEMDPTVLEQTILRFNEMADRGRDEDFGRGDSLFDCYHGDPGQVGAKKTLGPLREAPYHAVRIVNGALGTNGGPVIDEHGRVLDAYGEPLPGLYAAGNAAGSCFGLIYAGPGSTLGPGVTWGVAAGRHAMHQ